MAYRFKTSKFKNAAPQFPKREGWLCDISSGSPQSCGNHIKASNALMAFNIDAGGGSCLGVAPLDKTGRVGTALPKLHAHTELVTDLDFSPFNDYLLATCSSDKAIKIWDIPEGGETDNLSSPLLSLPSQERRVENVLFHPAADNILAVSVGKTVKLFDVNNGSERIAMADIHGDQLQGISWKMDGSLLATTGKDKKLRILDPRQKASAAETNGHGNVKDSRVCWLGNADKILSTGFSMSRERQVCVWDSRNFKSALTTSGLGNSTGVIMPFFDPDTNMVLLAGKGDSFISYVELTENSPYLTQGMQSVCEYQHKGMAMVPKRALDVMSCEVNRLLQLSQNAVIPIPYIVPRKNLRGFPDDLFPDTQSDEAAMTAEEWMDGANNQVSTVSLDPAKKSAIKKKSPVQNSPAKKPAADSAQKQSPATKPSQNVSPNLLINKPPTSQAGGDTAAAAPEAAPAKPLKKVLLPTTSKFRHMQAALMPRTTQIYDIKNVSISTFGECDGFHANRKWAAVPLGGPAGMIAIIDINKPGKLDDPPSIENSSPVMDFAWDPFDDDRLVVACDDAKIKVWQIPQGEWTGALTEPQMILRGHMEKIYFVKFHPHAKDVLVSASFDMTVKIWDLSTGNDDDRITLQGHTDQIFGCAWSSDGTKLATVCKDQKIRIYEPRNSETPVAEGPGPEGSRGGRVVWVCDDQFLLVSGFTRQSQRCFTLYSADNLSLCLASKEIDTSVAILVPYYDPDTNVVIATGKGDTTAFAFEVVPDSPYFLDVSGFRHNLPHQSFSFLPKCVCTVKDVEFARALRLTKTAIEPITFVVPRVKKEFFQDDLFPDTRITWESALTSQQWFAGENGQQKTMSLCPDNMKPLSSIPKAAPPPKKYESKAELSYKTDEEKKEELLSAMVNKLADKNDEPLPQEQFEGVDEDEWSD
ncbi:coronin-7-like [Amphiura filiformis]|uniref:coronin-7-like n=1 Tax=Amphiura filiformis TaxID=82378 RepID=UPI003B20EF18